MKVLIAAAALILFAAGCSKTAPTLAGGKPVTHWVEAAHGPNPVERKDAVHKLGNVGPADAAAFPAVVEALRDVDGKVRCEAVLAVLKFGPRAAEAVPTLTELKARDPNAQVRDYASRAIDKLATP